MRLDSLPWSDPTHQGDHYERVMEPPSQEFWDYWRDDKLYLKSIGVRVGKENGQFRATLTTTGPGWPGENPPVKAKRLGELPEIVHEWEGGELLGPQVNHVASLVRSLRVSNAAVDASAAGVGKTVCSLMVARNLKLKPVIICPKSVIGAWKDWLERIGMEGTVVNYEQVVRGNMPFCKRHPNKSIRPGYKAFEWNLPIHTIVILDEAHRCKGRSTLQGLLASSLKRYNNIRVLMLSATLAENPMDMHHTGYLLDMHGFTNFYYWLPKVGCEKGRFGWHFKGNRGMIKLLHDNLFPQRGSRLSKRDMAKYFPKNRIIPLGVDIDSNLGHIYTQYRKELDKVSKELQRIRAIQTSERERADSEGIEYVDPMKMAEITRLRQQAELLKTPALIELAKDHMQEGNSVVLFVQFRNVVEEVRKSLNAVEIHGDQTVEERSEAIKAFQSDKVHAIVCQIQAGGVGISLHQEREDMRPRVSLISPCYDAVLMKQALGRIERTISDDREDYSTTQYIVYDRDNELERRICEVVERKCDNIETLNDGDFAELTQLQQ